MKNNERNSRKRLNSLILLVAFTAVMLIVSTYAWFSTQKNVTIQGLKGVVNVAEGLQISLDGQRWVNTINFEHFDQTDNTAWKVKDTSPTQYLASGKTFQSPIGDTTKIKNVVPTELLPVSTTGYSSTGDGIGQTDVKFYRGTNEETIKLMNDLDQVTEDAAAGYFAFDLFLMNTSAGSADDELQLDPISDVIGTNEAAGVQNTARVALALYNNDGATDAKVAGGESGSKVIEVTSGALRDHTIKDIAIWEPNANAHTQTIVDSAANSLKLTDAVRDNSKYTGLTDVKDTDNNYLRSKFALEAKLPTYALTSVSKADTVGDGKTVHITDCYDWRTPADGVKKQFVLQTDAYSGSGSGATQRSAPVSFVSTKAWETKRTASPSSDPSTGTDTFVIGPNQYHKVRVYFWMEGQDPDCINAASLGKGLTLDLGFSKPGQEGSNS